MHWKRFWNCFEEIILFGLCKQSIHRNKSEIISSTYCYILLALKKRKITDFWKKHSDIVAYGYIGGKKAKQIYWEMKSHLFHALSVISVKTSSYKVSPNINWNRFLLIHQTTKMSLETYKSSASRAGLKAWLCVESQGKPPSVAAFVYHRGVPVGCPGGPGALWCKYKWRTYRMTFL